jgi:MFS family permease
MGEAGMAKNNSAIAWYGDLKTSDKRTFWACFGGWTLDSLNFFIFTFAFPAIVAAFEISRKEANFLSTAPLISAALGGWAAASLSDRIGRARVLQITILWFAFFTFLCAVSQDYWQLLVSRTLMGFGLGGEWAVGAALLGETIRAKDRGRAVGTMQSGWGFGWGIAALVSILFLLKLRQDIAWRALLCVGILPALLVFYIRRHVDDAPVFKEMQKKLAAKKKKSNFLEIFSPALLKTTILTSLLATGAHGGYYASAWYLDFVRNQQKISVMGLHRYLVVLVIGSILGYLVSAYFNDRIGRRKTFMIFAACSAASIFALTIFPLNNVSIMILAFLVIFFASGTFSGIGPALIENFPTRVRGSGMSFAYNSGRVLAAAVPWAVAALSAKSTQGQSTDLIAILAYGLVIFVAYMLPETKGRTLTANG